MQASRQRLVECSMECFESKVPSTKATALGRLFAFSVTPSFDRFGYRFCSGYRTFCFVHSFLSCPSKRFPFSLDIFRVPFLCSYLSCSPRLGSAIPLQLWRGFARHTRVHVSGWSPFARHRAALPCAALSAGISSFSHFPREKLFDLGTI